MTIRRLATRLLLRPEDLPASRDDFEVVGTFNPGAVRLRKEVVLLVRVAERPRERRAGYTGLPRWDAADGLTVDWVPDAEFDVVDPRVVCRKADGLVRLTFTSHLRVVRCGDGRAVSTARARRRPCAPAFERWPPCRGRRSSWTGAATTSRPPSLKARPAEAARLEGGCHDGRGMMSC